MITMEMIGKVRRLHGRDKKSVREIARATGLSRNTIDKWLQAPIAQAPSYRRAVQPTKLTPFHGVLPVSLHEFRGGWWQGPMAMR
jgi:transposase